MNLLILVILECSIFVLVIYFIFSYDGKKYKEYYESKISNVNLVKIDTSKRPLDPTGWYNFTSGNRFRSTYVRSYSNSESGIITLNPDDIKLEQIECLKIGDPGIKDRYFNRGLNGTVLKYFLDHRKLIPQSWKGKLILFPGTMYTSALNPDPGYGNNKFILGLIWREEPSDTFVYIRFCGSDCDGHSVYRDHHVGWDVVADTHGWYKTDRLGVHYSNTYVALKPE